MALEIYAYRCRKCGAVHYPYRMVCRRCRQNAHNEFDPVPLPRRGRLLTFTILHTLPPDFNVAKLGLGIVELEDGLRVTGQLDIAEPKAGMAVQGSVEVVRCGEYEKTHGLVFRKA
jgi:uncharacterized OB-fold protein